MTAETWIEGAKLLVTLGLEVYKAVKSGNRDKTVGEIFDGMGADLDEIDRLERARFGDD